MISLLDNLFEELKVFEGPIVIHWFRRDLRLQDNTALNKALASGYMVLPLYIFDEGILRNLEKDNIRMSFILQALEQLNNELAAYASGLRIVVGTPVLIFEKLTSLIPIKCVYINQDYEPYAIERDDKVQAICIQKGVEFLGYKDQLIDWRWGEQWYAGKLLDYELSANNGNW